MHCVDTFYERQTTPQRQFGPRLSVQLTFYPLLNLGVVLQSAHALLRVADKNSQDQYIIFYKEI